MFPSICVWIGDECQWILQHPPGFLFCNIDLTSTPTSSLSLSFLFSISVLRVAMENVMPLSLSRVCPDEHRKSHHRVA